MAYSVKCAYEGTCTGTKSQHVHVVGTCSSNMPAERSHHRRGHVAVYMYVVLCQVHHGGTQEFFIRLGSTPKSKPSPLHTCIPFGQKRHPFHLPTRGRLHLFSKFFNSRNPFKSGGGYSVYFWVGVCCWDSETFTLYQTSLLD